MGQPAYIDTLNQLVAARDEARATLVELHGVLKDLRQERAEIRELLRRGSTVLVVTAVTHALEEQIPRHVAIVRDELNKIETRNEGRWNRAIGQIEALTEDVGKLIERSK